MVEGGGRGRGGNGECDRWERGRGRERGRLSKMGENCEREGEEGKCKRIHSDVRGRERGERKREKKYKAI